MARRASKKKKAPSRRSPQDAIGLLKADHRQVEGWFEDFAKARSDTRKLDLAGKICEALTVHTQIEEELFYPAFFAATQDSSRDEPGRSKSPVR
jgi:hemerythrin superfamily protein